MLKNIFVLLSFLSMALQSFAQNDSHFIKPIMDATPFGPRVVNFDIEPALENNNLFSRSNNESVEGWYLMVPGKKGYYVEQSWRCEYFGWCTSEVSKSYLSNKVDKPIHFIISQDLNNSVDIDDIDDMINQINSMSDLHYHDYNYIHSYEFKDLSDYNLADVFDGTNYCTTGGTDVLQGKINPWNLNHEIVIFVSNSLIANINTHGTLLAKAYKCCNPKIVIGGISITADHLLLQHELYHLQHLTDETDVLYCNGFLSNLMNSHSRICDYFVNSKQILLTNSNPLNFHSTIDLTESFPQNSTCVCPDFNTFMNSNDNLNKSKNEGKDVDKSKDNTHFNADDFMNLLRTYDVGDIEIKSVKSIDDSIIKYGNNYNSFRNDYSKKVDLYLSKIDPEFLKRTFNLKNKEELNNYLKLRKKGHLLLIDDNFRAILKSRIIAKDKSFIKDNIILSMEIEALMNTYNNLPKN